MTEKALKPIKPFLNYEEQINNLIEQKGMIVNDHKFAVSKLEDISYFALIDGYKNLFYNPMTRKYKEGTTFEDLVALYEFDEKLRTLIFRYLCHFEQKMRSLISYHFCDTYSEKQEDYLNAVHYNNSGANLTGLIILMIFGTGFFMEKFSESKYYKKHILAWNDCYCYIKKHGFRMLMQILLGIILIFNTFLMLRGTIHDRYMPNDFVCIGNSKETTAVNTVVTARFNGLTKQFPFLWFNEMRGDSWVAISLSDYNKIYNKNESLNKNEIIRIWRKEGSRKSDLSDKQHRKIKSIALGKCGNMDEEGLEYKYNFQIKKEQIKEMIGFSMTGLVIIPDNIFTQAEKESDYKKMFMIINLPKKNLTVSTRYIEEKLQQGKLDEAFCKLTIQGIDKKENVLNQMVAILVAIIILIFTMFITWLMLQNDQEHLKRKYQIGAILGVKRKEGYLSVVKEISRDMWWSLLLAIGISGMFCGVFIKSYYYGTTEIVLIQKEVAMLGWILCIYGIIFMIFIIFSTRRLWKEISKIWGDKN